MNQHGTTAYARKAVAWRVRLRVDAGRAFVEGRAVNASNSGAGIVLSSPDVVLPVGSTHRMDVHIGGEPVFHEAVTIRHVTRGRVGLEFDHVLPIINGDDRAAPEGDTRRCSVCGDVVQRGQEIAFDGTHLRCHVRSLQSSPVSRASGERSPQALDHPIS